MIIDINDTEIFEHIQFPSGETHVRLKRLNLAANVTLSYRAPHIDLMKLAMATDVVRRNGCKVRLSIPYFPFARQDRIAVGGDSLSVKVFANFINFLNFESVYIVDPHSYVTPALIDRVVVNPQHLIAQNAFGKFCDPNTQIVAPDRGSISKALELTKNIGANLIEADKRRDPKTGALNGFTLLKGSPSGTPCLVVDDICDAGGTFIGLGSVLRDRGATSLGLFVTHGLFTKGIDSLLDIYDYIITTDSLPQKFSHDRLHIINV